MITYAIIVTVIVCAESYWLYKIYFDRGYKGLQMTRATLVSRIQDLEKKNHDIAKKAADIKERIKHARNKKKVDLSGFNINDLL